MKITYGKNESHDYSRLSYLLQGGDWLHDRKQPPTAFRHIWSIVWLVAAITWISLHARALKDQAYLVVVFALLLLPLHELCHALFLWLTGRRVYAIRFYPYPGKWSLNLPGAYVMPDLAILTRTEHVLLAAFPLLLLTVLPAVVALLCPPLRVWLLWIAFCNAAAACFDAHNILGYLLLPKNARCIGGVWCVLHEGEPVILRRLRIRPGATHLSDMERTDFRVEGRRLTEIPAVTADGVPELLEEFKQQFQLSDD